MEDNGIKSIRYPVEADEKLTKLALKLGRTKKLLFMQMIDYFHKSKKDPKDLNDEVLKKELVNGVNRIIAFIRRQESDFLIPLVTDNTKQLKVAVSSNKYLGALAQYAVDDEKNTKDILYRLTLLDRSINETHTYHQDKTLLKMNFKKILEYYISHREALGWPVSNAKKEELQNHVRQSLETL